MQAKRNVIRCTGPVHLSQKPQPLLRKRQWQTPASFCRHNAWKFGMCRTLEMTSQIGQLGMREQIADLHFHTQYLLQAADDPHRQQGVSAEVEVVIVAAYLLQMQYLAPHLRQLRIYLSPKCY